jgi:uncharacterized protein (DUF433 family)
MSVARVRLGEEVINTQHQEAPGEGSRGILGAVTDAPEEDTRFRDPLYTVEEAARFLRIPRSTLTDWVRACPDSPPIVTTFQQVQRGDPVIPFIGLAEGMVARAFRQTGLPMQYIRRALTRLSEDLGGHPGVEHALASDRIKKHGAKLLHEWGGELSAYTEVVSRNYVFAPIVEAALERIEFAPDGWARRLILPLTQAPVVVVDPERAFGQPIFIRGGARLVDVIDRFKAGERLSDLAYDFEVAEDDVLDVIRALLPDAA